MQTFTRLLMVCGLLLIIATAFYASTRGIGLASFNNSQLQKQHTIRSGNSNSSSYFSGRTVRGGGPRYGK